MDVPPHQPIQSRPSWWSRNWKWVIPVGCGIPVLVCGGFVATILFTVFGFIKSAAPYADTLATLQQSDAAIDLLGEPITAGVSVSGNLNVSGSSGDVDIAYSVSGPKASGTMYVVGTQEGGAWTYSKVELQADGQQIDLLPEMASAN